MPRALYVAGLLGNRADDVYKQKLYILKELKGCLPPPPMPCAGECSIWRGLSMGNSKQMMPHGDGPCKCVSLCG